MPHALYVVDVRLRDIAPPIWRTIELAGTATLEDLHLALQIAMGWTNSHLHQFTIGKKTYGMVDIDEAPELEDERRVRLQDVAKGGDKFLYEYDFGDDWEHDVTIKRVSSVTKAPRPRCTDGKRACPPEDCGGPHGYERVLQALANPKRAKNVELAEWSGDFEPERFELPKAGRELQHDMEELRALARRDESDASDEHPTFGLPGALVEAVLALEPMHRASLGALIAGSLAEELVEMQTVAAQTINTRKRQHRPTRANQRRSRT